MNPVAYLMLLASCLITGCSRVDSVSRFGVQATLIDANSGRPIAKHSIRIEVDRAKFNEVTNRKGEVEVSPVKYGYWTWLGGPMHGSRQDARIAIDCPMDSNAEPSIGADPGGESFPEHRGTIDLGNVNLQPR